MLGRSGATVTGPHTSQAHRKDRASGSLVLSPAWRGPPLALRPAWPCQKLPLLRWTASRAKLGRGLRDALMTICYMKRIPLNDEFPSCVYYTVQFLCSLLAAFLTQRNRKSRPALRGYRGWQSTCPHAITAALVSPETHGMRVPERPLFPNRISAPEISKAGLSKGEGLGRSVGHVTRTALCRPQEKVPT